MIAIIVVNGGEDFYTTMVSYGQRLRAARPAIFDFQLSASVTQLRPYSFEV